MSNLSLINSEALTWLWDQPDNSFGAVVTDPPEERECPNLRIILQECRRVASGVVIALAPLVWEHEGAEFSRPAPLIKPDSFAYWFTKCGPWQGVAPILCWGVTVPNQTVPLPLLAATGHKPALKPVGLFVELLKHVKGPVLDPFCGDGTCGVAARMLGMDCTMVDKSPEAIDAAGARIGTH